MPTAAVTVYNPTLTVSHWRRRELMQAALCIYVRQEIVKATLRTRDVSWNNGKSKAMAELLFTPV